MFRLLLVTPSGLLRYKMASLSARKRVPACFPGRNPLPQSLDTKRLPTFSFRFKNHKNLVNFHLMNQVHRITMTHTRTPGKLRSRLHKGDPGPWLMASVYIEFTMHISSATFAVLGKSSLIHCPLCPC